MNEYDFDNEIIDVSDGSGSNIQNDSKPSNDLTKENNSNIETGTLDEKNKKEKRPRKSIKKIWNDFSKKKKIITIVVVLIILILIISLIIYFLFFKKAGDDTTPEDPIIFENDNYRYENGKLIFIDNSGNDIGEYECQIKDNSSCYVAKNDLSEDTFDREKKVYENGEEITENTKIYYNKYVFVNDNDTIYLYDMENKEVLEELDLVKIYNTSSPVVVIKTNNKYGLMELTEDSYKYLIEPSYDYLGIANADLELLVATTDSKTYIINTTERILSSNINAEIRSVSSKYIAAYKNGSYYLYTYDFEEVGTDYDFIALYDDVIALVNSKKLYLTDTSLNKLYETGIKLENTNYVKEYVYDENKTLVETKESFSVEANNNKALVTVGDTYYEINMLEGVVSSTLSYVSYYDGSLYFYSDIEKEDLTGTYPCTNKNTITNSSSGLTNCYVYKTKDNYYSSIYNNQYVFIYDNITSSGTPLYYLYDIKNNKIKGTYSEIEIIDGNELALKTQSIYTSSSYIIVKSATGSNKDNYGVIEIGSSKVQGKVSFNYSSIASSNDYYLFISIDGTYSIYDADFEKVSNEEFSYIELYDDYYVGIIDDQLNVYKYSSPAGILESSVPVSDTAFTIDFTDGFKITVGDEEYNYDKDGKYDKDGEPDDEVEE